MSVVAVCHTHLPAEISLDLQAPEKLEMFPITGHYQDPREDPRGVDLTGLSQDMGRVCGAGCCPWDKLQLL